MTRFLAFCFLLLLRPTFADTTLNGIYLGKSQILDAAPPRQISLHANIKEWQADPTGSTIAYVGSAWENGTLIQTVKIAGVKRGQTRGILTTAFTTTDFWNVERKAQMGAAARDAMTREQVVARAAEVERNMADPAKMETAVRTIAGEIYLSGWSSDGRYLLIQGTRGGSETLICVDIAPETPRQKFIALPPLADGETPGYSGINWSPKRNQIAVQTDFFGNGEGITRRVTFLYDPATNRQSALETGPGESLRGWLDETHLLLRIGVPANARWFSLDITTNKETVLTPPPKLAARDEKTPAPKGLTLADEPKRVMDEKGTAIMDAHALWIRRTSGPKTLSAFPIALTPGTENPQAGWLPGGRRIAFVAHGDLFVADLIVRPALPREKLAVNETLTCPEERDLAVDSLKLIGLGIIQYAMDNDENFPSGAGVQKSIEPYIKDPSIFTLGKNAFVYKPPAKLALAAMDSPADTVIGTLDLPCATVSLYADGHVRAKMKPGFDGEK